MTIVRNTKVTCDACGNSVTYDREHDNINAYAPWLRLDIHVSLRRPEGQSQREFPLQPAIDACSPECATKALSQIVVTIPPIEKSA